MKFSRLAAVVAVGALATVALTACSSPSASSAQCSPSPSGSLSGTVSATGEVGTAPSAVSFPTPLVSDATETTTLVQGTGALLTADSAWSLAVTVYQGDSTTALGSLGYTSSSGEATPFVIQPRAFASTWPGLSAALTCGHVGDRIAVVIGTSDNSAASSTFQFGTDSSGIIIVDVLAGFNGRATGTAEKVSSVFPTVTLATTGQPGISTPTGTAPTETTIGVLTKGSGQTVGTGDTVAVQYSGWIWDDSATEVNSSWSTGQLLVASKSDVSSSGGLPSGFWKAVEGQTVGSQVIVIIPPKDGYADKAVGSIPASSTLIFVIDIVGTM